MTDGWLIFIDDDRGRVCAEVYRGRVFFHFKVNRWGVSLVRDAKRMAPMIAEYLLLNGIRVAWAYIREGDAKLQRFAQGFGFRELARRGGWVMLQQEIPNG